MPFYNIKIGTKKKCLGSLVGTSSLRVKVHLQQKSGRRKTRWRLIGNQILYQAQSSFFFIAVFFRVNFYQKTPDREFCHRHSRNIHCTKFSTKYRNIATPIGYRLQEYLANSQWGY